jgi:preprotein translocase subunit SecG
VILLIFADFVGAMLGLLLTLMAIFLILLVLVQRGRGGGLAGALGGMGGSSAFGAKAGDVFTKITIIAAGIWILLCIFADWWGSGYHTRVTGGATRARTSATAPADTDKAEPVGDADAATQPSGDAATSSPASAPASAPAEATGGPKESPAPSNP